MSPNTLESIGNVINSPKPFLEQFFESLEKIQLEFQPDGTPCKQQFLFGSAEFAKRAMDQLQQIESEITLKKRYDDIIERKKQEWRDRETARNLVD